MPSSIGPYEFRSLSKPGMPVERSLTVVAHAGVDGCEIWDDGERGMPFQVRSETLFGTIAQAYAHLDQFKKLKNEPPVVVMWATMFVDATKYKVLDVQLADDGLRPLVAAYDRQGSLYQAKLICDWTLLPIKFETEEE